MEKPINMECEICGKPVNKHNPIRAKIEGSVMVVCSDCAKLGKIQKAQSKPKFTQRKKNKPSTPSKTQKYSNKDEPTEELIEGFEDKIRNARETKNWSREDLGRKINEKFSVISKIEAGKMIPDNKVTQKLEKTLNIKLLEKVGNLDLEQYMSSSSDERTLGNIMKIKRK